MLKAGTVLSTERPSAPIDNAIERERLRALVDEIEIGLDELSAAVARLENFAAREGRRHD